MLKIEKRYAKKIIRKIGKILSNQIFTLRLNLEIQMKIVISLLQMMELYVLINLSRKGYKETEEVLKNINSVDNDSIYNKLLKC